MAEENADADEDVRPKSLKMPMILGVVACLVGAGGGYFAYGMTTSSEATPKATAAAISEIAFVPIEQRVISLGRASDNRFLRFSAQLEVPKYLASDVTTLMPRIQDVLNGYLRAIRLDDIEEPSSLVRIRAQMLRRVQTVVGDDAVRDLLVTEFVVS